MGLIHGQQPDSILEWRVYLALMRLNMDFQYKVQVMGGRGMRGGMEIDFLVQTAPRPTPVQVQGEYWHGAGNKKRPYHYEQYNMARMISKMRGQYNRAVEIWESKIPDVESAYRILQKEFLHG